MIFEKIDQRITSLFDKKSLPKVGLLVTGNSIESIQVRDFFSNKSWKQITLQSLQKDYVGDGSACLWFMTPDAALYYFPAYLKITALQFEEADAIATELVMKLRRVAEGEISNLSIALSELNLEQNRLISEILQYVSKKYEKDDPFADATLALSKRWGKFRDQ